MAHAAWRARETPGAVALAQPRLTRTTPIFASLLAGQRDRSLSILLVVQLLTLFVAIPLGSFAVIGRIMLDASNLIFAVVCVAALTRHGAVRAALLIGIAALAAVPLGGGHLAASLGLGDEARHEAIAAVALLFNGLVTALVARRVFGPGRVTAHRVQGAILLYLNVAALFAIAYALLEAHVPGAIAATPGTTPPTTAGARVAELTYFSLTTITTTGYGDLVPVQPFARSLANLESVFGQLFPATLLARLIALHLAHENNLKN